VSDSATIIKQGAPKSVAHGFRSSGQSHIFLSAPEQRHQSLAPGPASSTQDVYANSSIHLHVYFDDQGVGEIESLKNALEDIAKCKQMINDSYELPRIINKMIEPIGSDGDCKRLGHVAPGD
jgi:hypothetical protein